jgi:hypothetical protein
MIFVTQTLGDFQKSLDFFQQIGAEFSQGLTFFTPKMGQNIGGLPVFRQSPYICTTKIHLFSPKSKSTLTRINICFTADPGGHALFD